MDMTIEISNVTSQQIASIRQQLGVSNRCESMDATTVNIMVRDTDIDSLTDIVDAMGLTWRLV